MQTSYVGLAAVKVTVEMAQEKESGYMGAASARAVRESKRIEVCIPSVAKEASPSVVRCGLGREDARTTPRGRPPVGGGGGGEGGGFGSLFYS